MPFNPGTAAFVNSFVAPTGDDMGQFRRILHHRDPAGSLYICAQVRRTSRRKDIGVSFAFVPEDLGGSLPHGVAASFRYNGLSHGTPSITRSLREIRYIHPYSPIAEAIAADDLSQVQEFMAQGQVRPWDRNWESRNLLVVCVRSLTRHGSY